MNSLDDQLDRLLRAAGQIPRGAAPAPAFGLETRVLSAWRAHRETSPWSTALLLRGLSLALVLVLASLWSLAEANRSASPAADYLQLADSTVQDRDQL